jgi:hypothetical protein
MSWSTHVVPPSTLLIRWPHAVPMKIALRLTTSIERLSCPDPELREVHVGVAAFALVDVRNVW